MAFANLENDHMLKIDVLTKNRDNLVTVANDARLGISFGTLGAAESCLNDTIQYVKDRKQFNL